jgi:hypothetical protein
MAAKPSGHTEPPDPADELIRSNRDLIVRAEQVRRDTQALLLRLSIDRIQRCLSGVHREPAWALAMAEWVSGARSHPPQTRLAIRRGIAAARHGTTTTSS